MYFNKTNIKSNNNNLNNNNEADYALFILVSLLIISSIIFHILWLYTVDFFGYDQFHFFVKKGLVGIVAIFIMWYLSQKIRSNCWKK